MKTSLQKSIFKSDFSRRFPDPLNQSTELKIEHHILLIRAVYIPSGIPKKINPREQKIDYGIYKKVQESLQDDADLTFHLKNKGLTILAHDVEYSDDRRVATVYFADEDRHGLADGGHTYEIILRAQSEGVCPDEQYIKVEIITGIPRDFTVDIIGGLNTAVQVQEASLANLEGKFNWLQALLNDMPYASQIAYRQNDKKPYDIRDIISFLTLFNVEHKELKHRHPKEAYTSKAACLKMYLDDQESFEKLAPLVKDILLLHDYIHIKSRHIYNANKKGRAGGMKGVYEQRKRGKYDFLFMGTSDEYRLYAGTLFPMYGAMRFLVEQKPGEKYYSWKLDSFEQVKEFFDSVAAELVETTYNTSLNFGRKPNTTGKDDNLWDNLYKTVALRFLTRNPGKGLAQRT